MLKKKVLSLLAVVGMMVLVGCDATTTEADTAQGQALYYLPIVDTGAYWSVIRAGAESKADELGHELVVKTGAWASNQRNEMQIGFVREAIAENASAIALAAIDPDMLDRVAEEAMNEGIPVITFDADVVNSENRVSYVGTDNISAGEELGRRAAQHLKENNISKGSIALVATNLTQTTMINRQDGIKNGFEAEMGADAQNFTWLESIADDDQSAVSLQQLQGQIVANPDMVAVFSLGSEGPTTGVMEALRSQNKGGSIYHFGFDYTETWLNGVEEQLVTAIVNQDAFQIGQQIVQTMVDIAEGKEVQDNYGIPVTWVLAEDIEEHGRALQSQMEE